MIIIIIIVVIIVIILIIIIIIVIVIIIIAILIVIIIIVLIIVIIIIVVTSLRKLRARLKALPWLGEGMGFGVGRWLCLVKSESLGFRSRAWGLGLRAKGSLSSFSFWARCKTTRLFVKLVSTLRSAHTGCAEECHGLCFL